MASYQQEFIRFALQHGVLRFGEFVLKSGRTSPYFFNSGLFNSGGSLARLARFYAEAITASDLGFDMLYGPAYKGIPLVAAVAMALNDEHGRDLPYCFNRKEAKDHGEGGITVGASLSGRVVMVDDVISAGTSTRESVAIIRAAGAVPVAAAVSLDRQERGNGRLSAIQEIEEEFGLRVVSIIRLEDLVEFLANSAEMKDELQRLRAYRERYGT
ncbi:MAG: orotate phosphoribosyltransferase [Gammaproteobacteria bacterium]|nr:orotate phosphoribosyltransferase [Gammaproteobacteria bacterium]MDX2458984.1 orotate phosphoribosyltransferase [Gammaproteobacteria bacterium]